MADLTPDELLNIEVVADNLSTFRNIENDLLRLGYINDAMADLIEVAKVTPEIQAIAPELTRLLSLADSLQNVSTVTAALPSINAVSNISGSIGTVAGIESDVSVVAAQVSRITTVSDLASEITAVSTKLTQIASVDAGLTDVVAVAAKLTAISSVHAKMTILENLEGISGAITNVDRIATDVEMVSSIENEISAVANSLSIVQTASDGMQTLTDNAAAFTWAEANKIAIADMTTNITSLVALADISTSVVDLALSHAAVDLVAQDIDAIKAIGGITGAVAIVAKPSALSGITKVGGMVGQISAVLALQPQIESVQLYLEKAAELQAIAPDVTTVAGSIADIEAVAGSIAGVQIIANNYVDFTSLLDNMGAVLSVAAESSSLAAIAATMPQVRSIQPYTAELQIVSDNIGAVINLGTNSALLSGVEAALPSIGAVAAIDSEIVAIQGQLAEVVALGRVASNLQHITPTFVSAIDSIAGLGDQLSVLAGSANEIGLLSTYAAEVGILAGITDDITSAYTERAAIQTVAAIAGDVSIVAGAGDLSPIVDNIVEVTSVADNMLLVATVGLNLSDIDTVVENLPEIVDYNARYLGVLPDNPAAVYPAGTMYFNSSVDKMKTMTFNDGWQEVLISPAEVAALLAGNFIPADTLPSLQAPDLYTNGVPTTAVLGGVPKGSTFINVPITDLLDDLLHPFVAPSITNLNVLGSSAGSRLVEVGAVLSFLGSTVTWSIENGNVASAQLLTPSETVVLGAGDRSAVLSVNVTTTSVQDYKVELLVTDTKGQITKKVHTLKARAKAYYGSSSLETLTSSEVAGLSSGYETSIYVCDGVGYKYIALYGTGTHTFVDATSGFAVAMDDPVSLSVTNVFGKVLPYKLYRTSYSFPDTLRIEVD